MNSPGNDHAFHVDLPPELLYWALLDVSALPPRSRRDARALGYLFEAVLPLPIEEVHAVYRTMPSNDLGQVLACAIARTGLRKVIEGHPQMLTLTPETLPAVLRQDGASVDVEPRSLNLLTGEFEPRRLKQARFHTLVQFAAALLVLAALAAIGLERRGAAVRQHTADLIDARRRLIADAVPPSGSASRQPLELRLVAELRTLRQTRSQPDRLTSAALNDALPTLASILQNWPIDLHVLTESISITPTSITIRGLAPSSADAQELANALQSLPAWRMQQPQVNSTPSGSVNATLQWRREDSAVSKEAVSR